MPDRVVYDEELYGFLRDLQGIAQQQWHPESPMSLTLRRLQHKYDPDCQLSDHNHSYQEPTDG